MTLMDNFTVKLASNGYILYTRADPEQRWPDRRVFSSKTALLEYIRSNISPVPEKDSKK